jgi:hypothetical protein
MMTKRKVEPPDDPAACVTIAQKVAYSVKIREKYEALQGAPWAGPEQLTEIMDRYPFDARYPWTHPTWAEDWARAERAKREIERELKRHDDEQ